MIASSGGGGMNGFVLDLILVAERTVGRMVGL